MVRWKSPNHTACMVADCLIGPYRIFLQTEWTQLSLQEILPHLCWVIYSTKCDSACGFNRTVFLCISLAMFAASGWNISGEMDLSCWTHSIAFLSTSSVRHWHFYVGIFFKVWYIILLLIPTWFRHESLQSWICYWYTKSWLQTFTDWYFIKTKPLLRPKAASLKIWCQHNLKCFCGPIIY